MTWKTKPSTIDAKTAERRLRTISELRNLCLLLAQAKKESDAKGGSAVQKFSAWTDADRIAWEQLEKEAGATKN